MPLFIFLLISLSLGPMPMAAQTNAEDASIPRVPDEPLRFPEPDTAVAAEKAVRKASRLKLESHFLELDRRLDSLWRDSVRIKPIARERYRELAVQTLGVRDNTQVKLDLLKAAETDWVRAQDWEARRAEAQSGVDSLQTTYDTVSAIRGKYIVPADRNRSAGREERDD